MKLSEAVIPISQAKARTAQLVNHVVQTRRSVVITQNGRARVVVEDLRTYEETQESLAMLKLIAQGRRNIAEGKYRPLDQAFAHLRKSIRARRSA